MQRERHVLVNGKVRIEDVRLKHKGDIARRGRFIVDSDIVQIDLAFFRFVQTGDAAERRRLPRACLSEQDEELPVANIKGEVI